MKRLQLLKCYGKDCVENNRKWPRNQLTKYDGKNYCENCLHQVMKDLEERKHLYTAIRTYYEIAYPTPMMFNQIKKFLKMNMTINDILDCLNYNAHVHKFSFDTKYGIAFVPYVVEDVRDDKALKRQHQQSKGYDLVAIKINDVSQLDVDTQNKFKKSKLIDMNKENLVDG